MTLTLTYNALLCDAASTPRLPDGPTTSFTDGHLARFACDVLVISSGASGLAAECSTFESAFATHNAALLVTLDGATQLSLDATDPASALAIRPRLTKPGSNDDGDRSRRYRVEFEADLPASAAGASGGFIHETVAHELDSAGRATTTFSGRYSADAASTARDNYADGSTGAAARATTWLDAIDAAANHELIREETRELAAGTQLDYTRVYRQRLVPETADANSQADYTIDSLSLQRDLTGEHAAHATATPARYRLAFSASVQHTAHDYTALQAFYEATIRPALLARLQETWLAGSRIPGSRAPIIEDERVTLEADRSRITAEWVVLAPAGPLLSLARRQRVERESRITPRKLQDGQPHTHLLYCPGDVLTAAVTLTAECLDRAWLPAPTDPLAAPRLPADADDARWVLTGQSHDESAAHIGQHQADVAGSALRYRTETTFRWLLVAEPRGGGASVVPVPPLMVG